jgi:hypothetical protein
MRFESGGTAMISQELTVASERNEAIAARELRLETKFHPFRFST